MMILPIPRDVYLEERVVMIDWSDGHRSVFSNKRLRESCPCAICSGEPSAIGTSRIIPLVAAAPEGILAKRYRMVGRYAIAFCWSDGHDSGIYPYDYLLGMCECDACMARGLERKVGVGAKST